LYVHCARTSSLKVLILAQPHPNFGVMSKKTPDGLATTPTPWREVVLVCGKCSKKLHGGFGPDRDDTLARVLKQALRSAGRRREIRVIETKCLGLCPKDAVTVLPAAAPGALLTVAGPAGLARLLGRLGVDQP